MKTLKQLLEEHHIGNEYVQVTPDKIINITKIWLTQKRQKYKKYWGDADDILDELLEELKLA